MVSEYYLPQGTKIWLICNDPYQQRVFDIHTTRMFMVKMREIPNFVITAEDLSSIFGHAVSPTAFPQLFVHVFQRNKVDDELPKFKGAAIYGFIGYKRDVMVSHRYYFYS